MQPQKYRESCGSGGKLARKPRAWNFSEEVGAACVRSQRAGLPVLAERADLRAVEVGKEHARKFPAFAGRALSVRAGPFGNEDIAGVQRVRYGEANVFLAPGRLCPVVVDRLATDMQVRSASSLPTGSGTVQIGPSQRRSIRYPARPAIISPLALAA